MHPLGVRPRDKVARKRTLAQGAQGFRHPEAQAIRGVGKPLGRPRAARVQDVSDREIPSRGPGRLGFRPPEAQAVRGRGEAQGGQGCSSSMARGSALE